MVKIFGSDIGGVIIASSSKSDASDTSFFGKTYWQTPALPNSFEGLARVVQIFGSRYSYLLSKSSEETELKSRGWLEHNGFYGTGISPERVRFCRHRADKAVIAADLGITHYIDNHPGVLGLMESVPYRFLFNATEEDREEYQHELHKFIIVEGDDWRDAAQAILEA